MPAIGRPQHYGGGGRT